MADTFTPPSTCNLCGEPLEWRVHRSVPQGKPKVRNGVPEGSVMEQLVAYVPGEAKPHVRTCGLQQQLAGP